MVADNLLAEEREPVLRDVEVVLDETAQVRLDRFGEHFDRTDAQRALLDRAAARPDSVRWLLSSSEALDALRLSACGADWAASTAWATHPRIAGHARRFGFGRVVEIRPTLDAVAAALSAERA